MFSVTVIIPSYKPQGYLWECLASLTAQTLSKEQFEIILVLNGCCEPWKSQIEQYIVENMGDVNISFIQTDTPGVSNARNIALDIAKGEYIVFIDDDDYVSPCYLKELLEKAAPNIVPLCYPLSFVDGSSKCFKYYITEDYQEGQDIICHYQKAKRYFSGPVYKMIHKDVIGDRRFNKKLKNGEDSLFMFLISDKMSSVTFTSPNAIYYRRIRQGSAVNSKKNKSEVLYNAIRLSFLYSVIYWKNPFKYNFKFYSTRILAAFHGMLNQL